MLYWLRCQLKVVSVKEPIWQSTKQGKDYKSCSCKIPAIEQAEDRVQKRERVNKY